jgi:nucleoid-associated protein YgaU
MAAGPKKLRITPQRAQGAGTPALADGQKPDSATSTTPDPGAAAGPVELTFNPKEYTIEQSNTYAEIPIPGLEAPILQFVRGNTEKLSFDALVDCTEYDPHSPQRNAGTLADSILKLSQIDGNLHTPPVCTFEWGSLAMDGVIESVRRQFLLFDPDGTPTRIALSLSVKRYRTLKEQIAKINRRSPDRTRTVVVAAGDTLPAIAFRAYHDATMWRPIALHNKIADPARLVPGMVLEVPKVEGTP